MKRLLQTSNKLKQCESAAALIEFALWLPLMTMMFVATAELARYAIIHQKVTKVAHEVVDLTTRNAAVNQSLLTTYADAVDQIMAPFAFNGTIIYSSIASTTNNGRGRALGRANNLTSVASFSVSSALGRGQSTALSARQNIGCRGGCLVWQETRRGSDASKIATGIGQRAKFQSGYTLGGTTNIMAVEVTYNYSPMLGIADNIIPGLSPTQLYTQVLSKPRQDDLLDPPQ